MTVRPCPARNPWKVSATCGAVTLITNLGWRDKTLSIIGFQSLAIFCPVPPYLLERGLIPLFAASFAPFPFTFNFSFKGKATSVSRRPWLRVVRELMGSGWWAV